MIFNHFHDIHVDEHDDLCTVYEHDKLLWMTIKTNLSIKVKYLVESVLVLIVKQKF